MIIKRNKYFSEVRETSEKPKNKRKALKIAGLTAAGIGLGLLGRHYLKNRNILKNTKFTAEDLGDISGSIRAFSSPGIRLRHKYFGEPQFPPALHFDGKDKNGNRICTPAYIDENGEMKVLTKEIWDKYHPKKKK